MEPIVKQVHLTLLKRQKTVSVAESCTGGLVSNLLTYIGGSSKYFLLGVITYNNKAKSGILNIPASLIAKKGAVSAEVAEKMAQNVKKLAKSDFGIGITGIAGPTGATLHKPVGSVFIAVSGKDGTLSRKFLFTGNRVAIRKKSALKALELLIGFT